MIAIFSILLMILKVFGVSLSWGIVLTPLFIEIIYWFLEYIEYDSRMVDSLFKIAKKIEEK